MWTVGMNETVYGGTFSWMRSRQTGKWYIGGKVGADGAIVNVVKADGTSTLYRVGEAIEERGYAGAVLYEPRGTAEMPTPSKYARWVKREDQWIVIGKPGLSFADAIDVQKASGDVVTYYVVGYAGHADGSHGEYTVHKENPYEGMNMGQPYKVWRSDFLSDDAIVEWKKKAKLAGWG